MVLDRLRVVAALAGRCRARFGRDYPAMTLLGVSELFDLAAIVELVAVAVVPEER